MVATGSRPPYAVRFRAEKSWGVEAPIFKGPATTDSIPCLADVFSLCSSVFFTFWVTPENESAKRQLRRFPCSNAGFSGSPRGCLGRLPSAGQSSCIRPLIHQAPTQNLGGVRYLRVGFLDVKPILFGLLQKFVPQFPMHRARCG